jgi:hypothetical protein
MMLIQWIIKKKLPQWSAKLIVIDLKLFKGNAILIKKYMDLKSSWFKADQYNNK